MAIPESTQFTYNLNLTVIISVITACVATMATIINIFGTKRSDRIKEEEAKKKKDPSTLPGNSQTCKQHEKDMNRVETLTKDNKKNLEEAQKIVNQMRTQVATLEKDNENINKSLDEMKDSNKETARKLDDLLRQLMDWMND